MQANQSLVLNATELVLPARQAILRVNRLITSSCHFELDSPMVQILNRTIVVLLVEFVLICHLKYLDGLRKIFKERLDKNAKVRNI